MEFTPAKGTVEYSPEEEYFEWYLKELKEQGIIKDFFRPEPVLLIPKKDILVVGKRSSKHKTLLNALTYTPDFIIVWNKKKATKFIKKINLVNHTIEKNFFYADHLRKSQELISVIDVKPNFNSSRAHSNTSFPIKQKLMYHLHDVYVQKVVLFPNGKKKATRNHLFPSTFVPERFELTNTGKQKRKINYEYKTLNEFLNGNN